MVGAHSAKVCLQGRCTVAIFNLGREKVHYLPLDSPRVEHCLRSRECLRYNDKESFLEVDIGQGSIDINRIYIGQKSQLALL